MSRRSPQIARPSTADRVCRWFALVATLPALLLACNNRGAGEVASSSSSPADPDDDERDPTSEPPPAAVDCDVTELFNSERAGCTASGCHGIRPRAGLDLRGDIDAVEERLLAHESENCGDENLINLESPEQSLLLRKVDPERFGDDTCGSLMPPYAGGLEENDISCLEGWLTELVARGEVSEAPDFTAEWENAPIESALAKIKLLATGQAPTAPELELLKSDPASLPSVIESWQGTPAYERKLLEFFEIAFQQRLIGSLDEQLDVLNLRASQKVLLQQNVEEAFARTALRIVNSGAPFTSVTTTTDWELTTALVSSLIYADQSDDEKSLPGHLAYFSDPPDRAPVVPPTLEESIATGLWYVEDMSCDTKVIDADSLFDLMMGRVRCPGGGAHIIDEPILGSADYNDWRTVSLSRLDQQDTRHIFYDVPALRSLSELALQMPRVGYFTTPAFFANWPTNVDNNFRVTVNQTLITGLGQEISPTDNTEAPLGEDFLGDHALESSNCTGCHLRLDPMKGYFSASFDFDYQADLSQHSEETAFSFAGLSENGGDIFDFAERLGAHPRFAAAWVQKLCFYANSQACDENDPEFERLVAHFESSNFDFASLHVETLASPLITGLSFTSTFVSRQWLTSTARQDHLCSLIEERLGRTDLCQQVAPFLDLVAADEFARGEPQPIMVSAPSLLHAGAVEALCAEVASIEVSVAGSFPLNDPDASLAMMLDELLGLPLGHSRREAWSAALDAHYQEAMALGASNPRALRSAFILACTSPEVTGVGL